MDPQDDPEKRIRELERPLAEAARASESGSSPPPAGAYPPPPGAPWSYQAPLAGPFAGAPPQRRPGNRTWWIVGTFVVIGALALAGGIAAFAAHQLSGVRSIIRSTPTAPGATSSPPHSPAPSSGRTKTPGPSASQTSPSPPPGAKLSVSGINESRTIACNDSIVSVSGVSNTVLITGHCARISVSGVQNSITVDSVDTVDASGFNNKVIYHSGSPKVTNAGDSNVVEEG